MLKKIFITTGGTGGHILPAICLAKALIAQNNKITFFGDEKVINYLHHLNNQQNFQFKLLSSSKIAKNFQSIIVASVKIFFGFCQSLFFLFTKQPNLVIAFGGYASFPLLLASALLGKKIILHEQNAYLGKVNRIFARFATKIAISFPETLAINLKYQHKVVYTGNPVREEIALLWQQKYQIPNFHQNIEISDNRFGYNLILNSDFYQTTENKEECWQILILGGSGGAKIFSDILPQAFFNLPSNLKDSLKIVQQCRKELVESTFENYKNFNINVVVDSFFEDMPMLLKNSHLVIARAGASSIFEFCASKKPMILIPFPNSADNHQQKNAHYIAKNGGAILIEETDFKINHINQILRKLLENSEILYKMSECSAKLAQIGATNNLIKVFNDVY
jgi:UDP-N-acetylglucosamine--N-acetylmuramyl-(pentapeptide) pyrophosphoryl-undecaprenol N-acetylglucosamine transferase